ncbi:PREDICTED: C-C motif chemokine 3-like [Pterocles gutturalis]|uniref:C-C motif chemokine 3-like n=1 Tax=Pterocles gutturalis TaxID=240206 RepID=UPI0005284E08|nr:PREDICTED: C-C motif chemokine 3-like [Pterocles gutturalis]
MKVPTAALATLLLVAIWSLAEAHIATIPTVCCFTYVSQRLPRSAISSAYTTSSSCSQPAVILVTKKGIKVCADPQAPWVQAYLKRFQKLGYRLFPTDTPVQQAWPLASDAQQRV